MKKLPLSAVLGIAMLAFLTSCTQVEPEVLSADNTTSPNNPTPPVDPTPPPEPNYGYCDFGPVTIYGGGCFKMESANDCDLQWGHIVTQCP